jgi:hypothetical protein
MKLRLALAAALAAPALGACETIDPELFGAALSLYSDVAYLNGDCPFNLQKYHDREGHHHCSVSDESPRHQDRTGHHHEE